MTEISSLRTARESSADHAQEWLVGTCKEAGGITGITNDNNTLQRWALSFHWRSDIQRKTMNMFDVPDSDETYKEMTEKGSR